MSDFERAANFYLGKLVDPVTGELGEVLQYDARDLTTHAVCLGMTGSGKTGLCIDLLEEAAIDNIPSIIIDPKGDITNMLLTFPELRPADFQPWINVDDARRKGMTVEEFAVQTAQTWANGLADWGQGPERIRRLKDSAEFVIFTPGSDAGVQVSILQTLSCPDLAWDENQELLREKIAGTVSALLGLANVKVESVHSREHVLLSHIFEAAWRAGEDLDLAKLILGIQKPPIRKLGVFDIDTYFPPSDRMQLAMALNNIIAAPSFQSWITGAPLDISTIIQAPDGRPRVSIFYIAHLSDPERMFFVTLLLQQVQTWMRTLSGTTSLRAILYFDEVFGYFPPHPADPPSKKPLLTLLKQARAYGLGAVLVTQNPVDLDYKGLTNAGTWFIGKLQTDRDKMRVLEGLESVASQEGGRFERAYFDRLIGGLKGRQFILHNVHEDAPVVFNTRWAMSYLRGPLTRTQVRELMRGRAVDLPQVSATASAAPGRTPAAAAGPDDGFSPAPPSLPAAIAQYYLPVVTPEAAARREFGDAAAKSQLVYQPAIIGLATMRYVHSSSGIDAQEQVGYLLWPEQIRAIPEWSEAERPELTARDLDTNTYVEARFADLPAELSNATQIKSLEKNFSDYLYRNHWLVVSYNPSLKVYALPDDTERDFKARCQEVARAGRDAEIEKVKGSYEEKIAKVEDRIRREEQELQDDQLDYDSRKQEELLSAGESLLGLLAGRKSSRALSSASRRRRMTRQAKADVDESIEALAALEKEIEALQDEMKDALDEATRRWAEMLDDVREIKVTPRRMDVGVEVFGLAWAPMWALWRGEARGGAGRRMIPAYSRGAAK
jgi:hypothetical protein